MLSRPIMDHLTRLAMVYSVIEQIKAVPDTYAACKDDVEKLQDAHEECKRALLEHYGFVYALEPKRKDSDGIKILMSSKDNLRLCRHEVRFVAWLTSGMDATVRGTEWLTTVMAEAQVQYNTLPEKFVRMRELWTDMHILLDRIYGVFDEDRVDTEAMEKGLKLSARMPL
jgi:hypothetical protein